MYFSINSERKKGRVEHFWMIQIFEAKKVVHRYLQNNIWNFITSFSPWRRPRSTSLFWAFFSAWSIFSSHKRSAQDKNVFTLLYICCNLGKFSAPTSIWKIWVINNSECAANIVWWVYWMRNRGLLCQFLHLFYPCPLLTYSAMTEEYNRGTECVILAKVDY